MFCICRLPADGLMIECSGCQKWYHINCVDILEKELHCISDKNWYCKDCYSLL